MWRNWSRTVQSVSVQLMVIALLPMLLKTAAEFKNRYSSGQPPVQLLLTESAGEVEKNLLDDQFVSVLSAPLSLPWHREESRPATTATSAACPDGRELHFSRGPPL